MSRGRIRNFFLRLKRRFFRTQWAVKPAVTLQLESLETRQLLSGSGLGSEQLLSTALTYLQNHAGDFGFAPEDIDQARVTDQYETPHLGVQHIYLAQRTDGLDVADATINVNIANDGSVVSAHSSFVPIVAADSADRIVPKLSPVAGLLALADHYGWNTDVQPLLIRADTNQSRLSWIAGDIWSATDISAELQFVQVPDAKDGSTLELAWRFVVQVPDGSHWYDASVSALDGRWLRESDWVDHATYEVYAVPTENPNDGPRTLLVDPQVASASPYGWHDTNGVVGAEYTDTRGNNVFAQADRNASSASATRPSGGAGLNFSFPINSGQEPVNYQAAATTNLFYWNNLLHDVHYQYGFTESAGNFQENNYGHGGSGSDAVIANAQFGAAVGYANNATFATPPEGQNPEMRMYEFTITNPHRDSDLEPTIIVHEYGHGVSNRLTGGPSNANALNAIQSGGMGEGWSDWWSLVMTLKPGDVQGAAYPIGNYVLGQSQTSGGIRRYPYSFNMSIDPLTYGSFNASNEVHNAGEIWCSALWDMTWLLVNGDGGSMAAHGFDPDLYSGTGGNNLALQLVMDGLKLQPANPSFLDARDAILLADQLANGGANQLAIWTAFARRGMGYSADDGGSGSATSVVEAFDLPAGSAGTVEFDSSAYSVGQTIFITVRDIDPSNSVPVVVSTSQGDSESVTLTPQGTGVFTGSIQSTNLPVQPNSGGLNVAVGDLITVTYFDADNGNGGAESVIDTANITSQSVFNSTNVPVNITAGPHLSTIQIGSVGTIGDVNVSLDITHTYDADLDVFLIAPNGQRVMLFTDVGGGGDNFQNTVLDDEASTPITAGAAPFAGVYRPEGNLGDFDGMDLAGTWTLEITDDYPNDPDNGVLHAWSLIIDVIPDAPPVANDYYFDFGTATSPTAAGYLPFSATLYDPNVGYGWWPSAAGLGSLDRGTGDDLSRDLVYLRNGVFAFDTDNGSYDVTFMLGDMRNAHDQMGIFLETRLVDRIDTAAGEIVTRTYRTSVSDGRLTIQLADLGGSNAYVTIVGMVIHPVDEYHLDFGPSYTPVANGYSWAATSTYGNGSSFGWLSGASGLGVLARSTGTALTRDLAFVRDGTFVAELANGNYNVTVRLGDMLNPHEQMGVYLENNLVDTVTTAGGTVVANTYSVTVVDGLLNLRLADLGGPNAYVTIVGLDIVRAV